MDKEKTMPECHIADFWSRIKALIKQEKTTQRKLSETIGFSTGTLEVMMNRESIPNVIQSYKLANCLNTTIEYLLTGSDESHTSKEIAELKERIESMKMLAGKITEV